MNPHQRRPLTSAASLFAAALLLSCTLALALGAAATPALAQDFWVATDGSDQAGGGPDDPFRTIERAREAVRDHWDLGAKTINVYIRGGVYRLGDTLRLDADDSGSPDAEVVYQAAHGESVVISGGHQVTGWTPVEGTKIWQATVHTAKMPRQLYVNGQRAVRARTVDYPNYYYPNDAGYTYEYILGTDPQIKPNWNNASLVEAVTATQWKMMRCPVAEVKDGKTVIMQNPCWQNANVFPYPWGFYLLNWWENAYDFLDEPGEWYLNPVTQTLYYMPREGEDIHSAHVVLPVLEKLIEASGDAYRPVSHIRFKGLSFMHATWYGPNGPNGYALDQGGFHLTGYGHQTNIIGHDPDTVGIPGNLSFTYAQNITFEDNTFEHLGAIALNFGTGSQYNEIINNTFRDISAAAIQVGGIAAQDHHPEHLSQVTRDNHIADNLIEYAGQEFYDAPGIYIGFTARSTVEHNEIRHVPWTGIAIGWGWGLLDPGGFAGLPHATPNEWGVFKTPSTARENRIVHNKIEYFLEKLWDGGAIYNNGFQGTSIDDGLLIAWNVARHKRAAAGGNTFYTDGGSRFITVRENVSLDNPQGVIDFGPCGKASSFDLCITNGVPYGTDMGGCVPYGDLVYENNYLRDSLNFYDICTNSHYPNAPTNMSFIDNTKVSKSDEVPAWILDSAGRR